LERLVLLFPLHSHEIGVDALEGIQLDRRRFDTPRPAERASLEDIERAHIDRVLGSLSGNKTQAARILGIDYKTLLAKMKKYGLSS
jgi:DNA-binding NtrC family response regulator